MDRGKKKRKRKRKKEGNEKELLECVRLESILTHAAPLSCDVSKAVNIICRALILGYPWEESLKLAKERSGEKETIDAIQYILEIGDNKKKVNPSLSLDRGGYAPKVLQAALYFVHTYDFFEEALSNSLKFAGGANYCPVLVGSIAGARYGAKEVLLSKEYGHRENLKRVEKEGLKKSFEKRKEGDKVTDVMERTANAIGQMWDSKE